MEPTLVGWAARGYTLDHAQEGTNNTCANSLPTAHAHTNGLTPLEVPAHQHTWARGGVHTGPEEFTCAHTTASK